jgi:hypothetical protein
MENVLDTKYGLVNVDKVTAMVTTHDGALLIVGEKAYVLKNEWCGLEAKLIESRTERAFNVFKNWFERIVKTIEETLWKKEASKKNSLYFEEYNKRIALEGELKLLKEAKQPTEVE